MRAMNRTSLASVALFSTLLLGVGGCGRDKSGAGGEPNPSPTPAYVLTISANPNPADMGQVVTVDASSSPSTFASFSFEFGDGSAAVNQVAAAATHTYGVQNFQDTTYTIRVKGFFDGGAGFVEATLPILVRDLPPSVQTLDTGSDKKAIIGEWIYLAGKNFFSEPTVTVDGVASKYVEILDVENLRFRVPATARAANRELKVQWTGYTPYLGELDVKRYALSTSARHDKVYFLDVAGNEAITATGNSLDLIDAATVKISADGSTAYITDGRFAFLSEGTISIIDLTNDGVPVKTGEIAVGTGPLFDIETATDAQILVAGDSFGFTVFDTADPLAPVKIGYTSALFGGDPLNDVAACDLAVSADGSRVVALNAFSAQARIFKLNGFQVMNAAAPVRVNVGPKTQDAVISDDGNLLYVLGGGGEGAVPMDLSDPRAATISAINLGNDAMLAGPYKLSDLNATVPVARIPFDLAVSRTNPSKIYVTTLDEGFSEMFALLDAFLTNPTITNLAQLLIFLNGDGLSLGMTVPINGANTASPSLMAPMQETFTAPTSADLLYNDHRMLQSSFRLWYDDNSGDFIFQTGVSSVNLQAKNASSFIPFQTETLGFSAVFGLLQAPLSFGDVVFQP